MASLLSIEGGAPAAAAAAVTLAIFPLLLALQRRARAWYIRWRQWLILVLKACVTLASALMPDAYLRKSMAGAYGSACSPDPASRACAAAAAVAGPEPGWAAAVVRRASWGLPAMLVMNGLGE